jgi:DNA-binding MarR family transcriptional regulator
MSSAKPDPVEQFHHLAIALLRSLRRVDEANGLAGPRASALSVLVFRGPQSLGELAAAEGVKPPTMSRLVKAMHAEGLVESQVAEHDQRAVRIAPSAKGRRLMLRAREKRLAAIRELLRDASAEEKKALETVVGLLGRALRKR